MNVLNMLLLDGQAGGNAGGGGGLSGIIMIVLMIVIFYFFMIRPQSKKQKEIKKQREALQPGSNVVTAGGIHGKIKKIAETYMLIEVAEGVSIRVDKNSIYAADAAPEK
jgi:preprotein translocase subunit YajC